MCSASHSICTCDLWWCQSADTCWIFY